MMILSRVCVEFRDKKGETIFTVGPEKRNVFIQAPDRIKEDPIYEMLLEDGSMDATEDRAKQKKLEADPLMGTTAEGKREKPASSSSSGSSSGSKASSKSRKSKASAEAAAVATAADTGESFISSEE